jgi:hypothetical protein
VVALLVGAALVVLLIVAFPLIHTWFVIGRATSGQTEVRLLQLPYVPGSIDLEFQVITPGRKVTLVEVEVARPFSEAAAVARPDGFRYNPYLEDGLHEGEDDPLLARWHADWVRYSSATWRRSGSVEHPWTP